MIESEKDVTTKHNPNGNRWIHFKKDGTFESGGNPNQSNTGKYRIDSKGASLFIDSDAGDWDDSNWIISFEDRYMIFRGIGSDYAEAFQLVHVRVN